MIIARAHIIISAWIIHAARLCERRVRASRPKLKSASYIARSIKMSINPHRYRCLLLLLALSLRLPPRLPSPYPSFDLFIFFSVLFLLARRSREAMRRVPFQVRGSSISISLRTRLDSPPPLSRIAVSRFSTIRHFSLSPFERYLRLGIEHEIRLPKIDKERNNNVMLCNFI